MTFSGPESLSNFPYDSRRKPVLARNIVATSQPLAAQAGLDMLRRSGMWQRTCLALESGLPDSVAAELARRGHRLMRNPPTRLFGGAQLIACLPHGYCGASDHRKDGQAVGF